MVNNIGSRFFGFYNLVKSNVSSQVQVYTVYTVYTSKKHTVAVSLAHRFFFLYCRHED